MRLRAICFDYGGTLDGPANHWLDRFLRCYREAGTTLSFERFRGAFDHATQCGYRDRGVADLGLRSLVEYHVARQMEWLGTDDPTLARAVVKLFVELSQTALMESRAVLDRLRRRVALGVVSNFYGNVDRVLAEAGIAPWLSAIVDSGRVGVSKPDPRIFTLALEQLGCASAETLYVGDSFAKDVVGAHAAGLRTAWLVGMTERPCPAPELVDVHLRRLDELDGYVA